MRLPLPLSVAFVADGQNITGSGRAWFILHVYMEHRGFVFARNWSKSGLAVRWWPPKVQIVPLERVRFEKELWEKVSRGNLSAEEVFKIENLEQRRIAYELMDKKKVLELPDYKILDGRNDDGRGNPDKVISFSVKGFDKPFLFYNCLCPSTKREYFLQTGKEKCAEAKAGSFGFGIEEIEWENEW